MPFGLGRRRPAIADLERVHDLRGLAHALRGDSDPQRRSDAADALIRLDDPQATPHVVAAADGQGEPVASTAVAVLRALGPDAAALLADGLQHGKARRFSLYAGLLAHLDAPLALPPLLDATEHPHPEARAVAARALVKLGDPTGIRRAEELAQADPDPTTRALAAAALRG